MATDFQPATIEPLTAMLRGRVLHVERAQRRAHSAADSGDPVLQRAAEQCDPALAAEDETRSLPGRRTARKFFAVAVEFALRLCRLFGFDFLRPLRLHRHSANGERRCRARWMASLHKKIRRSSESQPSQQVSAIQQRSRSMTTIDPAARLAAREPDGRRPQVMYQRWESLLFLHWRVPAARVQATLPQELTVDTFNGDA